MDVIRPVWRELRGWGRLLMPAFKEWVRDRCQGMAAGLAFFALLGIAPLIALVIVLAEWILAWGPGGGGVRPIIEAWLGPQIMSAVQVLMIKTADMPTQAIAVHSAVGLVSLVIGTGGYFEYLESSIETIWDVRREEATIRVQAWKKLRAAFTALLVALFLMVTLSVGAGIGWAAGKHAWNGPGGHVAQGLVEGLFAYAITAVLIAAALKMLTPIRVTLRHVMPGAMITAALHLCGREVALFYLVREVKPGPDYVGETLLMLLLWLYWAHVSFLYGAELTRLDIFRRGGPP